MERLDEKSKVLIISGIWVGGSLFGGIKFINKYYAVGMSNQYCQQIAKPGQAFFAVIAFSFAAMLIYLFCSFIWKAVFSHGEERKICLYALPFFVVLAVSLVSEISIKGLGSYYTGDEKNIWDAAVRLYPFFICIYVRNFPDMFFHPSGGHGAQHCEDCSLLFCVGVYRQTGEKILQDRSGFRIIWSVSDSAGL